MRTSCKGCDSNYPEKKFEGECNLGVPIACRDWCAVPALRRVRGLERLIVAAFESTFHEEIMNARGNLAAEARRIVKHMAKEQHDAVS
jgi:hypothetical protein